MMSQTQTFADFNLPPYLLEAIKEINFRQPTPVQEKVIPMILKGESVDRKSVV